MFTSDGRSATTGADGTFSLSGLSPGTVRIDASSPGYQREYRNQFEVAADHEVDFALEVSSVVVGQVLDEDGRPIAGASVVACSTLAQVAWFERGTTDASGRVHFDVSPGYYDLEVKADGYSTLRLRDVPTGSDTIRLEVARNPVARVRVLDPTAELLSHYSVCAIPRGATFEVAGMTWNVSPENTSDGYFTVYALDPGHYKLRAWGPHYLHADSTEFTVQDGGPVTDLEIKLRVGATLTGSVFGVDGAPVKGVEVDTLPNDPKHIMVLRMLGLPPLDGPTLRRTRTDVRGRFEFTNLEPASYRLQFAHREYAMQYRGAIDAREGHTTPVGRLTLLRGVAISGTVRQGGRTAFGAEIIATLTDGEVENPLCRFRAQALRDGTYSFPQRLPPGRYAIRLVGRSASPLQQLQPATEYREVEHEPSQQVWDFELSR